ncbi:prolyl oligopeptidase family serine peptidase [Tunturiibacter gelidoferens]|uniref:Prolyl oligopeptidase family serine peptidase n=1 Tax=Tunturiibacter gelidiferens TaxID=3069689 RepID=A0AAU7Z0L5_9BACT
MPLNGLRPKPVTEVLHGVTVVDHYRWLEDRNSAPTEEWIADQQLQHDAYFAEACPADEIRSRVNRYLNVETIDQPAKIGDNYFYRRREKNQEQPCIWVRAVGADRERVLVDPSAQGPFASVAIHRISDDGSLLAYSLKHGGERNETIHIMDVATGNVFEDQLQAGYPRGFVFDSDNAGFCYCHESPTQMRDRSPHEIRHHILGHSSHTDLPIFCADRTYRSRLVLISDNQNLGAVCLRERGTDLKIDFYRTLRSKDVQWKRIFDDKEPAYGPFLRNGRTFVHSLHGAPNGRIVELNEDGSEGQIVVPEWKTQIRNLRFVRDSVYVTYISELEELIHVWTLGGHFLGTMEAMKDGSFALLPAYSGVSDTLFCSYESFTQPPAILEYKSETRHYIASAQRTAAASSDRYHIERISYPSLDGTRIPISLLTLGDIDARVAKPTILTAYGGFGTCTTPRFSALVTIMLELGAVFAVSNIRGGGEFGEPWHTAARGRNRQIAFDDFICAAEWLCARGVTTPRRLAIFGGSNSGLLVGTAMTQRPDLFKAVLSLSPILDMLRYESFGDANKWAGEYGTTADAADFAALYGYSPYHHVRDDVNYPAALFVCGDKDMQCDPTHVRKMAARLQDRISQTNPIVVDYSPERGHSPVMPLSTRIEALTRRIRFLCTELDIEIPIGGSI